MIKAIETKYKGYRFRSRLEARWAVFFDTLGLSWEYEPEGFELPGVGRYLPDFYINDLKQWVEVKPTDKHKKKDRKKWDAFATASGQSLLICVGVPEIRAYDRLNPGLGDSCLEPYLRDVHNPPVCFNSKYLPPSNQDGIPRLFELPGDVETEADCYQAIEAARSARFEFGETP